ncbi:All-trans-phytoene synthase [bacterium HR33]|nr:All-trans-phytoene synthase [bacterium HR33]
MSPNDSEILADRTFCDAMLPRVSRTFALCIRLLPQPLERCTLVAYLLCRVADTLEDSEHLPPEEKRRLLGAWSKCLEEEGPADPVAITGAFPTPATDEERLVREADRVWREFRRLPPDQRAAIRPWVQEMCSGMAEFAGAPRGAAGRSGRVESLATMADLDRYCYYVAGTVGHLLTELFRLHDRAASGERYGKLKSLATSFGRGLQLTNIIKDVSDDRRRGFSFVPRQLCELFGIRPEELQEQRYQDSARRIMLALIRKAKLHLNDALAYTTTLPRTQYGIRLFCLTALYFAVRTLRLAEKDEHLLDPEHKVKISRSQVRRTVLVARLVAPSNALVRAYFRNLAGEGWPAGGYSLAGVPA